MFPKREPGPGLPNLGGDNLIVPERPELPEIPPPLTPPVNIFNPLQASLDRIERKLQEIDNRLKTIESKL
jgi:hypothetical protein